MRVPGGLKAAVVGGPCTASLVVAAAPRFEACPSAAAGTEADLVRTEAAAWLAGKNRFQAAAVAAGTAGNERPVAAFAAVALVAVADPWKAQNHWEFETAGAAR